METGQNVVLRDLGNGHWEAVCGDRSFRTDEQNGDLCVDSWQMAGFVFGKDSRGPEYIVRQVERSIRKGLILRSEAIPIFRDRIDGKPGKNSRGFILRRNVALIVANQCALLPSAQQHVVELARKMADVFEMWLDRRKSYGGFDPNILRTITELSSSVAKLADKVATLPSREDFDALQAKVNSQVMRTGLVDRARARELLDRIAFCAECFSSFRTANYKVWNQARKKLETRVRKEAGWPQSVAIHNQPEGGLAAADLFLRELENSIDENTKARLRAERERATVRKKTAAAAQMSLFH